jgi:hypothetical protein
LVLEDLVIQLLLRNWLTLKSKCAEIKQLWKK